MNTIDDLFKRNIRTYFQSISFVRFNLFRGRTNLKKTFQLHTHLYRALKFGLLEISCVIFYNFHHFVVGNERFSLFSLFQVVFDTMVIQTGSIKYCAQSYKHQPSAVNINRPYYTFMLPSEYCLAAYVDLSVTGYKIKYNISALNIIFGHNNHKIQ